MFAVRTAESGQGAGARGRQRLILVENFAAELARLKGQGSGDMYVFGSADLSRTLMNEGLFDEYRIGIAPVVHGRGRLLFGDGVEPQNLNLLEARPLSNGCVILRYTPK